MIAIPAGNCSLVEVDAAMSRSFVHEALFYRDADEYLAGTMPFVRAALAAGEPVLVAVPGPRIDLLSTALNGQADGVRFQDMTVAGRNPGKIIPYVLYAFVEEHAGHPVRIIGEPIWAGRSLDEYPACVQHEALINVAFAGMVATILCPYDIGALAADVVHDATRTHPVLVAADARQESPTYADPDDVVEGFNRPLPLPAEDVAAVDFDAPTLGAVRAFLAAQARQVGLSRRRLSDLQLAANELATNSITHGGGSGRVSLWRTARQVICEVRDRGRARSRLAGRVPPAPDSLGGRGLVLVNYVSDLVRIHTTPDGTVVRLYLDV
jgi:anti-sigma regulatory factor (Ser/Thr protein kinase)